MSLNNNTEHVNIHNKDEQPIDNSFQNLRCLRIQENLNRKYFLYYKQYPKPNSNKFPQNLSAIFFYFNEDLDEKFFYLYISLVGQIDNVSLGSYFNKKGSKAKRKIVHFAIVKFVDEESLEELLDQKATQKKINNYLEQVKHKRIDLDYDPLKGIDDDNDDNAEGEEDDDGFVEVKKNTTKNHFSKGELSFKVGKRDNDDEDDLYEKKKKKKQGLADTYWNFQVLDKKRQSK